MSRSIRSHDRNDRVPDVASMIKPPRQQNAKNRQREVMLCNMARAYNLKLSYGPSGIYIFTNEDGREIKVWGLWAAYQFMRGVEFTCLGRESTADDYEPGTWIDTSLWRE